MMQKLLNHCDMELMKMAMLKHEETFRQQVHELHRLYRVQKQLMGSGLSGPACRRPRRRHPRRALDLHLRADDYIGSGADHAKPPSREDELELTLAVGGGQRKRRDNLASSSDCGSGGGRSPSSSSSTSTSGSPYQTAVAFRLQEGAVARQQQQQAPWLVHCLSLRMA